MSNSTLTVIVGICLTLAGGAFIWSNIGVDVATVGAVQAFTPTRWTEPAYVLAGILILAAGIATLSFELEVHRAMSVFGVIATGLICWSASSDVLSAYAASPTVESLVNTGRLLNIGIGAVAAAFFIVFTLIVLDFDGGSSLIENLLALLMLAGGTALTSHSFTGAHWGWGVAGGLIAAGSAGFLIHKWFRDFPEIWRNLAFLASLVVLAAAVFTIHAGATMAQMDMLRVGGGILIIIPAAFLLRWSTDRR